MIRNLNTGIKQADTATSREYFEYNPVRIMDNGEIILLSNSDAVLNNIQSDLLKESEQIEGNQRIRTI